MLETFESLKSYDDIKQYISFVSEHFSDVDLIDQSKLKTLESTLLNSYDEYMSYIVQTKNQLDKDLFSSNEEYQIISNDIWETTFSHMSFEDYSLWAKNWNVTPKEFEYFVNVCQQNSGWHYPGIMFGAKDTELVTAVNFLGPFYLVEQYSEYIDLQKKKIGDMLAKKASWYQLSELDSLPNDAAGVAVIYNELPFLPFSMSSILLETLALKLYPGGNLIFNYNDCKTVYGFQKFEMGSMVFTTPDMFDQLLEPFGFKQVRKYNSENEAFSFLVYQKNGDHRITKKFPAVGFVRKQPSVNTPDHTNRLEHIRKLVSKQNS